MTDNVVNLQMVTRLDLPVDRVLNGAMEANQSSAVVIGYTEDGEFYIASTYASGSDMLWALELARHKLFKIVDDLEG